MTGLATVLAMLTLLVAPARAADPNPNGSIVYFDAVSNQTLDPR